MGVRAVRCRSFSILPFPSSATLQAPVAILAQGSVLISPARPPCEMRVLVGLWLRCWRAPGAQFLEPLAGCVGVLFFRRLGSGSGGSLAASTCCCWSGVALEGAVPISFGYFAAYALGKIS